MSENNTKAKGGKALIASLAAAAGTVLMIIAFFLPFVSATDDYREYLSVYSSDTLSNELGISNAADLSMLDFFKLYSSDSAGDNGIIYVVFIAALAIFSLLSLVAALIKKPIFAGVTAVLAFVVFCILTWDFSDRGLVSGSYDWGIARYFYYIGFAVIIISSIWLFIEKRKAKRSLSNG